MSAKATALPARQDASEGRLFVIVGPSGSGKDTLIDWLRLNAEADILFARRTITRPACAGGEAHEAMSEVEFAKARAAAAFCVSWEAHGLHYGLRRALKDHVATGSTAVVNGSRQALPLIRSVFENTVVVSLSVAPAELARRLGARGRENAREIRRRLARAAIALGPAPDIVEIDNTGPVEIAGNRLLHMIRIAG